MAEEESLEAVEFEEDELPGLVGLYGGFSAILFNKFDLFVFP